MAEFDWARPEAHGGSLEVIERPYLQRLAPPEDYRLGTYPLLGAWYRGPPDGYGVREDGGRGAPLMEGALGRYERLAAPSIAAAPSPVAVVNPRWARDFAKSLDRLAKIDKIDAFVLARFASAVGPSPSVIPDEEAQERTHVRGVAPNLARQITTFTEMISPPTTPTARLENRLRECKNPTLLPIK